MATHRINKVLLDFSYSKKEKGTALQKTKQLFYDKSLPQLNTVFDAVDEYLYLQKLEIDLGQTTEENFEQDFLKAFIGSFEKIFPSPSVNKAIPPREANIFSAEHFLFFLEKGYWPWNFQQKNEADIIQLVKIFLENQSQAFRLFQGLESKKLFLADRLIQLISGHPLIRDLLIGNLEKYHPALKPVLPLLPAALKAAAFKREGFYYFFTRELLVTPPLHAAEQVSLVLKRIIKQSYYSSFINQAATGRPGKLAEHNRHQEFLKLFFSFIEKHPVGSIIQPELLHEVADSAILAGTSNAEDKEAEKIHIANAGLILFHPYLQPVFRDLNWINEEKKFVSRKKQQRAVLFLQHLVNGKSRQAEHQLVLNKLLCNWPIHLPVKNSGNFSPVEKNAAVDLVESLKEHWVVMKNTSNRGLAESFVNRAGLVQKTSSGFLIQPERKTIDILLDTLPFGINTIKLPWNEYLIYTEW